VTRPDLLARTIVIRPTEPKEYRTELEMEKIARELMPSIPGGYLDLFSAVLRELPNVELSSEDRKNRLVDYTQLGEAVSRVRKKEPGVFVSQYASRRRDEVFDLFDDNPVAGAIVKLTSSYRCKGLFAGTVGELHTNLAGYKGSGRGFPTSAKGLKDALNRIVGPLQRAGIKVEFGNTVNGRRRITIENEPVLMEIAKAAADAEAKKQEREQKIAAINAAAKRRREEREAEQRTPSVGDASKRPTSH